MKRMEDTKISVFLTPHYHYDYLWCDTPDGMGAKTAKIIQHALLIMRKYPEYKYVIDSVMSVEYFRLHHPDMMGELKQRVREKRIELIGGMVIAPDSLIPNGESLVRQILYGARYFKEHFDVDSKVGYLIDTFGQTHQLPQILKKAGFDYFIFVRGARNRNLPEEFLWESPDGSKILTHWMYATYTWFAPPFTGTILPPLFPFFPIPASLNFIPQNFKVYEILKKLFPPIKYLVQRLNNLNLGVKMLDADMSAGLKRTIETRIPRATTNNIFILNGTDNVPPSSHIIDVVEYVQKKNKKYDIKLAIPSEFLREVSKSRKKFGVVKNYEFGGFPDKFPGTWSNRIRLKQKIRQLENQFYLTELFSTLTSLYAKEEYPIKEITKAIWRVLCCDFHDGICGCHVDAAYTHMMKMLRLSELQLKRLCEKAFKSMCKVIDTSTITKNGIPLLIFNPLFTSRTETAKILIPKDIGFFIIKDLEGNFIPFQKDALGSEENAYLIKINNIPSISFKIFSLEKVEKSNETILNELKTENYSCHDNLIELKTDRFTLTFEDNKLRTITDEKNNYSIKASNYFINDLRILNDRGDSYLHGKMPKKIYTTFDNKLEIIENGPVRVVIKMESKLQCKSKWFFKSINEITQFIIIHKSEIPRIDFITRFRNRIKNIRIQACFPLGLENPKFHSETPYGFIERDIKPRIGGSWEDFKKKFAHYDRLVPVINWMDASDIKAKKGITLINNGIPEHEIGASKEYLFLTLLKSTGHVATILPGAVPMVLGPFYNIPKAYELADQEFHYSLYFHDGDIQVNNLRTEALRHNMPLITRIIDIQEGELKNGESLLSIEPENFIIKVIKKPENGKEGIIIRIVECAGVKSDGKIKTNKKIKRVDFMNLLEIPVKKMKLEGDYKFTFSANPQEILTFLINFHN